ncbi:hypothetical protein [Dyadobacter fanqingshengii]|uniref:Uncharacterized protein n=1 Tax=Dyadobacter fanqingshengii TaxID=2906443 RepID=A0A9X1PE60_9BACT|nr:hypothetical protein [Dyadobacter fanqingshengii]MCF0042038.1 hypothetical protein [Dyadobacter fanqingshengii]MCF2504718.1 hypothetical protein [Dyadobacter fanqingshengii]USJ36259.1 hypothetical protein NFI81_00490 [Dyadobacter fanqingshengii]
MSRLKTIRSDWFADELLIITQISGDIENADVIRWEQTLHAALDQVPDSGAFKIFINLYGFKAVDLEAHKQFRNIIPLNLASYGWKVGYVAMFPEEAEKMIIFKKRNVQCIAAAHCHQDVTKIEKYESLYSSDNEHFFTDAEAADAWIRSSNRSWS